MKSSDFSLPLLLTLAGVLVLIGGLVSFVLFRPNPPATPIRAMETAPAAPATPGPAPAPPEPVAPMVTPPAPTPTPAAKPPPALPPVQGIFYRPDRPTAIIDGKTVRPGSSIGDFQVLEITFDTVVVGNGTQTNALRLPER